ncbi:uncharacterized protein LOC111109602 [Crassostrea virginica]
MNTLVVFSILVASCYAGYDKRPHGGYKYGTCPHFPDYGAVGQYCNNDYDCPGAQKCCNYRCQVPVEAQRPGNCPYHQGSFGTGRYCNTDRDCYYNQKCCTGPYGTVNTCKYVSYYPYGTFGGNVLGSAPFGGNVGSLPLGPFGSGSGPYNGGLAPYYSSGVLSGGVTVYDDDFSGVVGGVGGVFPGVSGVVPGASGVFPGASGVFPGASGVFPGASGVFPGASGVVPGASGVLPGVSVPSVGSVPSFAPVPRRKVY